MEPAVHCIADGEKLETKQDELSSSALVRDELEKCSECGKSFVHSRFIDHLFHGRECMRRYWEEEEKTHVYRLRHRLARTLH